MSPLRRADRQRTGTPADLLVLGLGNPGEAYEGTRHNVGAEVVALLAERHGARLRNTRQSALAAEVRIGEHRVVLAVPQTFMNQSGLPARALARRHGLMQDPARVVVVHDELDLPAGRTKVKAGGGLAGHNGLASVRAHLRTDKFTRIRIGIGKPPNAAAGADYVLKRPGKADRALLDEAVALAADAAEALVEHPVEAVMTRVNRAT